MMEWRDIPNHEGSYQVNSQGDVRSLDRHDSRGRLWKGQSIAQQFDKDGYKFCKIQKSGKQYTCKIHALVMAAFIGPRPEGLDIDHEDRDRANNNLSNLSYQTRRQNTSRTTGGTSKYIGVSWRKGEKKWIAHIRIEGKQICLGTFKDEVDAANAYQEALRGL